jgi:hypothetical protein
MRSYRSIKRATVASILIVVAIVVLTSGTAAAPPGHEDHCNKGNVTSAFQAGAPGVKLTERLGLDHAGLAEGVSFCQYRLFAEWYGFDEVCFCEDDFFFGGTTLYELVGEPDGLSPSEARESLNQWEVKVFLTPEGEEPSQLDVVGTAVKGALHPRFGRVSWQQRGVFFQLPPGDYLSTYWDCHPDWGDCGPGGDGWWDSNVLVRVLPHDVAHDLGPPTDSPFGTVQCPEE